MISRISSAVLCIALTAPVFAQTNADAIAAQAGFGGAVAATDDALFVGSAPIGWPHGNEPAGTVYQYARDGMGAWVEVSRLQASDGRVGDSFGRSIFVQDGILVVGAPGMGAAYVFESDEAGSWMETGKLIPDGLAPGLEFAGAIARAGLRTGTTAIIQDRIIVSAFDPNAGNGQLHVFRRTEGFWGEQSVLRPDSTVAGFGWAVAAGYGSLFVGAPSSANESGAVVVFDVENWAPKQRIVASDSDARSRFGTSLLVADGQLLVGAPGTSSVHVYDVDETGWSPVSLVRGVSVPAFGSGIARSARHLLVGGDEMVIAFEVGNLEAPTDTLRASDDRTEPGFGVGLAAAGSVAVIGSPRADYEAGLATAFEFDGRWMPSAMLASELDYLPSLRGDKVDCNDGQADQYACDQVDLVSMISLSELRTGRGVTLSDVWGWEDPETGKEWVLQARTDGVAFVDISDPGNPVYVGELMRTAGSPGAAWRDVKVYRNHAYIVADGSKAHGVQIFDLTRLRNIDPGDMPVAFEESAHYSGVNSTHNIVINEDTGFAYAVGNRAGGETCGGQLHMMDLRDPVNPVFAGCFSVDGAGGTHDAQCVIYRGADADYAGREICMLANGSSLIIADVTEKDRPVQVALATYPLTAYTHQGWLTEDHNYFYMNDELDEMNGIVGRTRTLVWDVQDLDDPTLVNEVYLDSGASDHNLYVRGKYLYESNYQAGLRILDISDPVNPVEIGHFDTAPFAEDAAGFGGSWSNYPFFRSGIIAVSSRAEGLFLLRKRVVDL